MKSNVVAALILIVVGLLFLANNLGWTNLSIGRLITTWWPAILVAVGVGMLFGRGK
jgi:lia operon protein LiaF